MAWKPFSITTPWPRLWLLGLAMVRLLVEGSKITLSSMVTATSFLFVSSYSTASVSSSRSNVVSPLSTAPLSTMVLPARAALMLTVLLVLPVVIFTSLSLVTSVETTPPPAFSVVPPLGTL